MKRFTLLFIFLGIIFLGLLLWWSQGTAAVNPTDKSNKIFLIQKGQGIRQVANQLKQEELIKDPTVFFLLVKKMGLDNKIQAGDFRLSPSMTAAQIADALTHGTLDLWVTIPEGKRAEEVAQILKSALPTYTDAWEDQLIANEGYLFPDTYLLPRDADSNFVISLLRNTFDKKYATLKKDTNVALSKNDIVTLASLIEREVRYDEDRPIVASVIYNRLDLGMPLQLDATVQYVLGYNTAEKSWWKKHLTYADLTIASAYNTYKNTGLPPSPIASPGLAALKAAMNPSATDYLYYISDSTGHNHYGKTVEQHNANIKKFGL